MQNWGLCLPFSGVSAQEVCLGIKAPVPLQALEPRAFFRKQALEVWDVGSLMFVFLIIQKQALQAKI